MANIILNEEKLKACLQKSGIRQGCPLSPYVFDTVVEVLAGVIGITEEAQRGSQTKKKSKYFYL